MLFEKGMFNPQGVGDDRTATVLHAATDRAAGKVRPSDLLASAIESGDAKVLATLAQALEPGSTPLDLRDVIEIYNPMRSHSTPTDFDGRRECFSSEALEALDKFDTELKETVGKEGIEDVALELLLACVLFQLDAEDQEFLTTLDAKRSAELFHKQVELGTKFLGLDTLFDAAYGRLRSEEFSESAWAIMEHAGVRATDLGYDRILPPHCFLALLGETEGVAEHLVRLQAQPEIGPGKVADTVVEAFRLGDRKADAVELVRGGFGEVTVELLRSAQKAARLWGSEYIDTSHLLLALVDDMPPRLASVLQRSPLELNLVKMREHLGQYLRDSRTQVKREVAFRLPTGLLLSEDLTYLARTKELPEALHFDTYFDVITKALYRRDNNHVLITGLRGVGKTALVRELSRKAAAGDISFLKRRRFLWVDCRDVAPDESRDKLEAIFSHVAGRTDLILCLDGLGSLLRAESGGNNKLILRSALKERQAHLIGVMSNWDFEDLLSSDHELLEFFTVVNVEEPKEETAVDIVKKASAQLELEYKLTIEEKAIERAVVLSNDYILNERLPMKAIKILQRVCEDLDYERTERGGKRTTITVPDVITVISEISGVPEGTLSGVAKKIDYQKHLTKEVVGQDEAVKAVATEIQLIKAGLTEPGKPASVMLFAGLTGSGKTELAKVVARFYSSSKRLQTYTMGNFIESHSVSGIIGVPPGYVGHEQGGRLINDLNSDPYCVFLLDEAEKPHPDVWKPFLNLFDEGWITDTRGVKAFADRAIIILTSNAGHEIISKMSQAGDPMDKIIEAVKDHLPTIRHASSNQPVFSPEFLARIKRIIIFKSLDEQAMEGICRKLLKRIQNDWKKKREKTIDIPDNLIKYIAKQSHTENERSGGKEGGRIVSKLISELIEVSIQREASKRENEYKTSEVIELIFLPPAEALPHQSPKQPKVEVSFRKQHEDSPDECIEQVVSTLNRVLGVTQEARGPMQKIVSDCLASLEAGLKCWERKHSVEAGDGVPEVILERFRRTCADLEQHRQQSEQEEQLIVNELITILERNGDITT